MSTCMFCGDGRDVHEVRTHDYGTDPSNPWIECYCPACLVKLRLFCERHQRALVSVHDSSEEDEEPPHDYSTCQLCALETVSSLLKVQKLEMLVIFELSDQVEELGSFAEQVGEPDVVAGLDVLDLMVYGAALSAAINGESIFDFVSRIAFDGEQMTMQ